MWHPIVKRACTLVLALLSVPVFASATDEQPFSKEQIEQLVAPVALYPDSLLSQVLMAATYPADVADAAKWAKANPKQKGDGAVKAVDGKSWDPSVKALAAFPQVLLMMGEKPDWVQNLGDAFLASSKDVLDAAQRLRTKAQDAGNLKSNEQQNVVAEQQVIKIEPVNPQIVYVPTYNPVIVYGMWPYPAYMPFYYPPPPYYYPGAALASGIAFGIGVGIVASLWGSCDWHHGSVNINVNKFNSINVNHKLNASQTNFQHNAANRRGVPYHDAASRQKYGKSLPGAEQREGFRGHDSARDAQRQQAQNTLQQRGIDPAKERDRLRTDPQARDRAQSAARDAGQGRLSGGNSESGIDRANANRGNIDRGGISHQGNQARGGGDNAFRGAGNGAQSHPQIDRGNLSRGSMGGGMGGGGMHRGGGGGGLGRHR